jgi:hypothetical protein
VVDAGDAETGGAGTGGAGTGGAGGGGAGEDAGVVPAAGAGACGAADAAGVNDGLRPLFTAGAASGAAGADCADGPGCAVSVAVAVAGSANQALLSGVIVCRLACRPLSCPLSAVPPATGCAERAFGLAIVSAGSGTAVPAPGSGESCPVLPRSVLPRSVLPASVLPASAEEPLLAPLARCAVPERELPDLVRDDDMMLLSTTASVASPSGSASRPGGARMRGGCVARPASSTPSSSVLTGAPLYLFVDTIRELPRLQTPLPPG